jgi:hypothetical protein
MKRFAVFTTVFLGLAAATLGQQAVNQDPFTDKTSVAQAQKKQMYEDIEIMRRLLKNKIQSLYPNSARNIYVPNQWDGNVLNQWSTIFQEKNLLRNDYLIPQLQEGKGNYFIPQGINQNGNWWQQAQISVPLDIEGVYLKGHGIIYTVTLPTSLRDSKSSPPKPQTKPISDWDRVRKEMRGEKVEESPKTDQSKDRSIATGVLELLAENGKNLTQLGDNESITIIITFRSEATATSWIPPTNGFYDLSTFPYPTTDFKTFAYPTTDFNPNIYRSLSTNLVTGEQQKTDDSSAPKISQDSNKKEKPRADGKPNDNLLLADLLMKQGKWKEAYEAYEKALQEVMTTDQDRTQVLEVLHKILQFKITNGQDEEAKKILDQIA